MGCSRCEGPWYLERPSHIIVMGMVAGRGVVRKDLKSAGRVGLKGATYLGSHFFLNALMNLRIMAIILTVLGNE